jgi:hypothetical protein
LTARNWLFNCDPAFPLLWHFTRFSRRDTGRCGGSGGWIVIAAAITRSSIGLGGDVLAHQWIVLVAQRPSRLVACVSHRRRRNRPLYLYAAILLGLRRCVVRICSLAGIEYPLLLGLSYVTFAA